VRITDEDLRRFQEIWREEFEEEISPDEAREHITRLDEFFLFLARRPLPSRSEDTPEQ
jgi:hypothetical protein